MFLERNMEKKHKKHSQFSQDKNQLFDHNESLREHDDLLRSY